MGRGFLLALGSALAAWPLLAHAQAPALIDFETYPDGAATGDQDPIDTQYPNFSFQLVPSSCNTSDPCSNPPLIAKVDEPLTAFTASGTTFDAEGWPKCDPFDGDLSSSDMPSEHALSGCSFLTDDDNISSNQCALLVTYATPVVSAAGTIVDIDNAEEWTLTPRTDGVPQTGTGLVLGPASPDTGDGQLTEFQIVTPTPFNELLIDYTGSCQKSPGLAFDNFVAELCTTMIRFEELAPSGEGIEGPVAQGSSYAESGFVIEGCQLATLGDDSSNYSGSTAMHAPQQCDTSWGFGTRLRAADNKPFSLCSMKLTELDPSDPLKKPSIEFNGIRGIQPPDFAVRLDGDGSYDPQRVFFTGFDSVEQVQWHSTDFQWDDICICPPAVTCVTQPLDLVAWWSGDDCSATDRKRAHHGTYTGSPPCTGTAKVGHDSMPFDDSAHVTVPDHDELEPGDGSFTIDLWVYAEPGSLSGTEFLLSKQGAYALQLVDGVPELLIEGSNGSFVAPGPAGPLNARTWHFVAATIERAAPGPHCAPNPCLDTVTVYRDDVGVPTLLDPGTIASSLQLSIGADPFGAAQFFDGALDEVEIYTRALSTAELASIRNAGLWGKCKASDRLRIKGSGVGGEMHFVIGVIGFQVTTMPGDTPEQVAGRMAAAVREDPGAQQAGISAVAVGNEILIATGTVVSFSSADPGLEITLNPPQIVPAVPHPLVGLVALCLLIPLAAWLSKRTSSHFLATRPGLGA